ncbi:hypothetical protein HDU97_001878 [Phlyctochytrium planicorne]|nr:hypothetical protein HDU97_001878 [Phlyctochytrium planicorne]
MLFSSASMLTLASSLWMASSALAQGSNYKCDRSGNTFCVSWTYQPSANPPSIIYTLSSATHSGWIGLGIGGGSMASSKLYIASGSSSSPNIAILSTKGNAYDPAVYPSKPSNDGVQVSTPSGAYVVSGAVLSASFSRPLSVSGDSDDVTVSSSTSYIWGVSNSAPNGNSYQEHQNKGIFGGINVLSSPQSSPTTTSSAVAPKPTASTPATTGQAGQAISEFCNGNLCVAAIRDGPTGQVTFAVQSKYSGYTAFGVGSSTMTGATVYVAWSDGKGGYIVSQRDSTGHVEPEESSSQTFKIVSFPTDAKITALSGAVTKFAIQRPASDGTAKDVSITGTTDFIWAGDNSNLAGQVSSSSISQHGRGNYGSFNLDVSKLGTTSTGSSTGSQYDVQLMRLLHGVFMFIAWGVLPFFGIFIARYMKDRLGHLWYILHLSIMLGGVGAFTLAGLVCIELPYVGNNRFFSTYHGLFGFVLAICLFPVQVALGFISNHLWSPERTSIPWWDQLHWWIGRISVLGAVPLMYYGLQAYGASNLAYVGLFLWIGVGIVILVAGQFAIGVVHHVAKKEEDVPMTTHLGSGTRIEDGRGKY